MSGDERKRHGIGVEHRQLERLLESVAEAILTLESDPDIVRELVNRLVSQIHAHFHHEESSGFFADTVQVAPRLQSRADELLAQHQHLSDQLARLQSAVQAEPSAPTWRADLQEQLADFSASFHRHEAAENALLMDAYGSDIGAED